MTFEKRPARKPSRPDALGDWRAFSAYRTLIITHRPVPARCRVHVPFRAGQADRPTQGERLVGACCCPGASGFKSGITNLIAGQSRAGKSELMQIFQQMNSGHVGIVRVAAEDLTAIARQDRLAHVG